MRWTLTSETPDDTTALADAIGRVLEPGDVLLLTGEIGAGKTHFARSLIQSCLDEPEDIPSPTFTLVQVYETRIGEVWHSDLYRLSTVDEVAELGLLDAFETAICLIEWPDRLGELTPSDALSLHLTAPGDDPDERVIAAEYSYPKWEKLAGLASDA